MKTVFKSYATALLMMMPCAALAVALAHFANSGGLNLSEDVVRWMRICSTTLAAAVALGRCGWGERTWDGQSVAEKADTVTFRILYHVAFFLTLLSFLVRPH